MLTSAQKHWGIEQWAAWLKDKDIPILPATRAWLLALTPEEADIVSARELTGLVMSDPLLALRLLRRAEQIRSHQLGHETTTPLATVLQLGFKRLSHVIDDADDANDALPGFAACAQRAVSAAHIGHAWAAHHADISPDEVAFAALLEETGELLLWAFVPDLPAAALEALRIGRAQRNAEAQELTAGFSFRGLTLELADMWQLPRLITQLIKGSDNVRANIARLATDTARHLQADPRNRAIVDDLKAIREVIPGVTYETLMIPLNLEPDFEEVVLLALSGESSEI